MIPTQRRDTSGNRPGAPWTAGTWPARTDCDALAEDDRTSDLIQAVRETQAIVGLQESSLVRATRRARLCRWAGRPRLISAARRVRVAREEAAAAVRDLEQHLGQPGLYDGATIDGPRRRALLNVVAPLPSRPAARANLDHARATHTAALVNCAGTRAGTRHVVAAAAEVMAAEVVVGLVEAPHITRA